MCMWQCPEVAQQLDSCASLWYGQTTGRQRATRRGSGGLDGCSYSSHLGSAPPKQAAKRIKDAAIVKRQRIRQQNIAANEAVLMSEEEAWRHIQDQDLGGEDEDEGEEDPTERQQRGRHGNTPSSMRMKPAEKGPKRPLANEREMVMITHGPSG